SEPRLTEVKLHKIKFRFFFGTGGTKKKLSKKKCRRGFRPLRRATKATRLGCAPPFEKGGRKLSLFCMCKYLCKQSDRIPRGIRFFIYFVRRVMGFESER
ncbi:MAG: hypothetical protein ACI3XL_04620, partial [Eubacteriales bacterium]